MAHRFLDSPSVFLTSISYARSRPAQTILKSLEQQKLCESSNSDKIPVAVWKPYSLTFAALRMTDVEPDFLHTAVRVPRSSLKFML